MFKRAGLIILILVIAIAMFTFSARNTGMIGIDLIYTRVTTSIPLAFTVAFAVGWLFGVACMGLYAFRLIRERRSLRRDLHESETEVSSLRNLPLSDAD